MKVDSRTSGLYLEQQEMGQTAMTFRTGKKPKSIALADNVVQPLLDSSGNLRMLSVADPVRKVAVAGELKDWLRSDPWTNRVKPSPQTATPSKVEMLCVCANDRE